MVTESLQTATRSLAVGYGTSVPGPSDGVGQATFAGANIGSVSGCQFQIFHGDVKIVQQSKRRRVIIESDDED